MPATLSGSVSPAWASQPRAALAGSSGGARQANARQTKSSGRGRKVDVIVVGMRHHNLLGTGTHPGQFCERFKPFERLSADFMRLTEMVSERLAFFPHERKIEYGERIRELKKS